MCVGGVEANTSPSSIFILGSLAQLHPHKDAHTGNFLNAKDDFSCQPCTERWESSSEGDHVPTQATVDGLSRDVWGLCHTGPFPAKQRDRKWPGMLGGHKRSSVCQTTIRHHANQTSDGGRRNVEARVSVFR